MDYELRPAKSEDFAYAYDLYRGLMHDLTLELLPWKETSQRAVVADGIERGAVQLVWVGGARVGWIQVNVEPEAIELGQIYLERAWQGRGLGTRLIEAVKRQARAANKPAKLSVVRNNLRARALYERLGFREVSSDQYKHHLRWMAPQIVVSEDPLDALAQYEAIPIAFRVERVLELTLRQGGLGGFALNERAVEAPWVKDYDALGERPSDLPRRFDLSRWGLLAAHIDGKRVGGALLAFDTPGVHLLAERKDLTVIWDLRVAPEARGQGVGAALFAEAGAWARARGCRQLLVETQNINVAACRFYASRGCELGAVNRFAYPTLPHEVQLLWFKELMG